MKFWKNSAKISTNRENFKSKNSEKNLEKIREKLKNSRENFGKIRRKFLNLIKNVLKFWKYFGKKLGKTGKIRSKFRKSQRNFGNVLRIFFFYIYQNSEKIVGKFWKSFIENLRNIWIGKQSENFFKNLIKFKKYFRKILSKNFF